MLMHHLPNLLRAIFRWCTQQYQTRPNIIVFVIYISHYLPLYEWRKKILTTRNRHGQSGWSPISCQGLYFHAMCENRVSVSGWSPNIGCEGFHTKIEHPKSTPYYVSLPQILSVSYIIL
jgi:hypothetical protein